MGAYIKKIQVQKVKNRCRNGVNEDNWDPKEKPMQGKIQIDIPVGWRGFPSFSPIVQTSSASRWDVSIFDTFHKGKEEVHI